MYYLLSTGGGENLIITDNNNLSYYLSKGYQKQGQDTNINNLKNAMPDATVIIGQPVYNGGGSQTSPIPQNKNLPLYVIGGLLVLFLISK